MQDFAKTKPYVDHELVPPADRRNHHAGSVLFEILLGAMAVFAGFKASVTQEIHPNSNVVAEDAVEEDYAPRFEFYEMLKRDNHYPPFQSEVTD